MIKKNKITFRFHNNDLNDKSIADELIKTILVKATPTSSCWWSKLKSRTDKYKDNISRIKGSQSHFIKTGVDYSTDDSGNTAKTCPGILGLLSQTFLIKSPTDIMITINNLGQYVSDISDKSILTIQEHPKHQFVHDDNTLFDGKIAIKFTIAISIKTTGFPYILTNPTYHSDSGMYVPMGIINERYSNNQQLNLITLVDIPKEEKTITIKAGDVIGYLVPFAKSSLSFSTDDFLSARFIKSFNPKQWFNE
jgi:ethanolamine utilization protein EutQ (cupin superfamily)